SAGWGSARGPAGPVERRGNRIPVAAAWAAGPWDEGGSALTGRLRAPAAGHRERRFEQLTASARQIIRGTQMPNCATSLADKACPMSPDGQSPAAPRANLAKRPQPDR